MRNPKIRGCLDSSENFRVRGRKKSRKSQKDLKVLGILGMAKF